MSDTVYIKISQSTEVHEPEVRVKDIAQVHCRNKAAEARIKALKVTSFKERDREASYVGSVMDLLEELEGTGSSIQINSVGETDFIVSYNPQIKRRAALQWMKTAFVSAVSFCGAAFAIMTFNNDVDIPKLFAELYEQFTGRPSNGFTILEVTYSIGIGLGVLIFFNHFMGKKLTADPTPMEVEMRAYEDQVDTTVLEASRRAPKGEKK